MPPAIKLYRLTGNSCTVHQSPLAWTFWPHSMLYSHWQDEAFLWCVLGQLLLLIVAPNTCKKWILQATW